MIARLNSSVEEVKRQLLKTYLRHNPSEQEMRSYVMVNDENVNDPLPSDQTLKDCKICGPSFMRRRKIN